MMERIVRNIYGQWRVVCLKFQLTYVKLGHIIQLIKNGLQEVNKCLLFTP